MLVLLLSIESTCAEGAFAVNVPSGGLRNGFAYGLARNFDTEKSAVESALRECREQALKQGIDESRCRLIEVFKGKCVAVAMDANAKWAGWGIAQTKEAAQGKAIADCRKGAPNCTTAENDCD